MFGKLRRCAMRFVGMLCACLPVCATHAAIIPMQLIGRGGKGLLGSNVTPSAIVDAGSGDAFGVGILFNDATNVLTINVTWGSVNGYTDLTGNATAGHLHGPTADGGAAAFNESASPKYSLNSLAGWNSSATSGGFSNAIDILPADAPALLNGQFYLAIHTSVYADGEIRGNLAIAPEPIALGVVAGLPLLLRRRSDAGN